MAKSIEVKIITNKSNGQRHLALPSMKKIGKKLKQDISNSKRMKINIEELYPE